MGLQPPNDYRTRTLPIRILGNHAVPCLLHGRGGGREERDESTAELESAPANRPDLGVWVQLWIQILDRVGKRDHYFGFVMRRRVGDALRIAFNFSDAGIE
jgi:hypothetical protein